MFEKKTTIILGAGASNCHGLPTGYQLRTKIIQLARNVGGGGSSSDYIVQAIRETMFGSQHKDELPTGSSPHLHTQLADELVSQSEHETIDEFLEANDKYEDLARFYIALVLLDSTYAKNGNSPSQPSLRYELKEGRLRDERISGSDRLGWYSKLVRHINKGCPTDEDVIARNEIDIITFNYDRSLEHFLEDRLFRSGKFDGTKYKYSDVVKIHHVYGVLDDFLGGPKRTVGGLSSTMVFAAIDTRHNIQLIRDNPSQSPAIRGALKALKAAEDIVVIGFGFAPENWKLLNLPQMLTHSRPRIHLYDNHPVTIGLLEEWFNDNDEAYEVISGDICQAIDEEGLLGRNYKT